MSKETKYFGFLLALLLLSLVNIGLSKIIADTMEPLENLRNGWDVQTIYEVPHPPGPICVGSGGNLFYGDNLNHMIMKIDDFGVHTEYISTGSLNFGDIEYQPNHNRLIGVTDSGFYTITSTEITLLQNYTYSDTISEICVNPTNDTFYCGSLFDGTDIFYYDADGNKVSTILSNVQGCSQMILNNDQSILYYTETYLGSFSSLNLTSNEIEVLRTGFGLPGTQEVIGIGVDDDDELYCMTADGENRGFYKNTPEGFVMVMNSKGGMSKLTWSSQMHMFVAGGSFGGCLIGYNPDETEPEYLSPIVNSHTLIETHEGNVLYGLDDQIFQIKESGPSVFIDIPSNLTVMNLILDNENNIFTLLGNDSIVISQVYQNGSTDIWFNNQIHESPKSMEYDTKHNNIILFTEEIGQNRIHIYRIPVNDPALYTKIITMENVTKIASVVDDSGNIYVYEAYKNTLFKIPDGASETEIVTTYFANFTGIYGPNFVVVPTLGYNSIENGIMIGRNDDIQIWLLDENERVNFAFNNKGIDNSAFFQNHNKEILVTQSTLVLKLIYNQLDNPTSKIIPYITIPLGMVALTSVTIIVGKKNKRKV
jgi:hypothetical protein